MRRVCWLVSAVVVALSAAGTALGAPGDLDTTFSGDGLWTKAPVAGGTWANDLLIQPDGSLMLVGTYGDALDWGFTLVARDGSRQIDALREDFDALDQAFGVARQADGKIVAIGSVGPGDGARMAVARVTSPSVFLDQSFVGGGKSLLQADLGFGRDLLVQPDGKLVLVGSTLPLAGSNIAVVRLNADGSPDTSFDGDGVARIDLGAQEFGEAVALQPDGKVVVAGRSTSLGMLVARLLPDGTPDLNFDGDGVSAVPFGIGGEGNAVLVQADGKLVVAGRAPGNNGDVGVARLNQDGSPDPTFAGDGTLTVDLGASDAASDAAFSPSGKVILAATAVDNQSKGQMALVQVTTDGKVDTSFDFDGIKKVQFGATQFATAVAVQPDGAIVLAGFTGEGDARTAAVARVVGEPLPPAPPAPGPAPAPAPPAPAPSPPVGAGPSGPLCNGLVATIVGTTGVDRINGTPGADVIVALGGNDVIDAKGGNDVVCAGAGADVVRGGNGADTLLGQAGDDDLQGGPGADRLDGGAGADALRGGRGRDVCAGGKGKDTGLGCEAGAL